jgi:hypothetical protein
MVNDSTSDEARQQLAGLIPSVIDTYRDDPRWDVRIARRAALTALPIASAERQRVLAVGVLGCERALAELEARPLDDISAESKEALAEVPDAHRWAMQFSREQHVPLKRFLGSAAPAILRIAVMDRRPRHRAARPPRARHRRDGRPRRRGGAVALCPRSAPK